MKSGVTAVKTGGMVGKGTHGGVYKSKITVDGEPIVVALKEVVVPVPDDDDARTVQDSTAAELIAESDELLIKLPRHPNLVHYYGLEYAPGLVKGETHRLLLTMEWVEHPTRLVGPVPEARVVGIARQVLSAVALLHAQGVTHDDIRPHNVMVVVDPETNEPHVHVSDYGLFKKVNMLFDPAGGSATLKQQPAYTAPEVFTNGNDYDPVKADVWAIGGTLVELLTGKQPFDELLQGKKSSGFKIVSSTKPPQYSSDLSDIGKDFLDRCFSRNFTARPTCEELLQHPWVA